MIIAKVKVSGVHAHCFRKTAVPAGMIGGQIAIEYTDPRWKALTRTAVLRGCVTRDVLNAQDLITIPQEVVAQPNTDLYFGMYGMNEDGTVGIPLIEAYIGRIEEATDPEGEEGAEQSLPLWAQLQLEVEALKKAGAPDETVIREAVDAYFAENPPEAASVTINGEAPDSQGNFTVETVTGEEIQLLAAALV